MCCAQNHCFATTWCKTPCRVAEWHLYDHVATKDPATFGYGVEWRSCQHTLMNFSFSVHTPVLNPSIIYQLSGMFLKRGGLFPFKTTKNRGQLSPFFTHNLFSSCLQGWRPGRMGGWVPDQSILRPPSLQAAATVRHWAALARETQTQKQPSWFGRKKTTGWGCMTPMGEYIYIYIYIFF